MAQGAAAWRADVRCPNYGLTDTDALRLTAYLETLRALRRLPREGRDERTPAR